MCANYTNRPDCQRVRGVEQVHRAHLSVVFYWAFLSEQANFQNSKKKYDGKIVPHKSSCFIADLRTSDVSSICRQTNLTALCEHFVSDADPPRNKETAAGTSNLRQRVVAFHAGASGGLACRVEMESESEMRNS